MEKIPGTEFDAELTQLSGLPIQGTSECHAKFVSNQFLAVWWSLQTTAITESLRNARLFEACQGKAFPVKQPGTLDFVWHRRQQTPVDGQAVSSRRGQKADLHDTQLMLTIDSLSPPHITKRRLTIVQPLESERSFSDLLKNFDEIVVLANKPLSVAFPTLVLSDILIAANSALSYAAHLYGQCSAVIAPVAYPLPWFSAKVETFQEASRGTRRLVFQTRVRQRIARRFAISLICLWHFLVTEKRRRLGRHKRTLH